MQRELSLYYKGRKRLAEMMDVAQPDSFSDDDIAVSIQFYPWPLSIACIFKT